MFLLVCGFSVLELENETMENVLMKSVMQMDELLQLSDLPGSPTADGDLKHELKSWLIAIKLIIFKLVRQKKVLKNEQIARYFAKFYIKLYKMFRNNTSVESETDFSEFQSVLGTLENSTHVFRSQKLFVVRNFIRYFPTSYQYQGEAITCFMCMCKHLKFDEQEKLERVLMQKFRDLLLYSDGSLEVAKN